MVGFEGVEPVIVSDKAVEGAVGFEVGYVRISGGVALNELTKVNDGFPGTGFGIDAGDDVRRRDVAVGAASAGRDCVEGAVEEGNVRHALQVALSGEGGWESRGNRGPFAGLVQFRDASSFAPEVGADGWQNLGTGADS